MFLVGIVIALLAGAIVGAKIYDDVDSHVAGLLGVLGFIIGILSFFALGTITKERVPTFLLGALILVIIGATSSTWEYANNSNYVNFFQQLTTYLAYFATPAAGLLAIRAIWDAGKSEEIEKVLPK